MRKTLTVENSPMGSRQMSNSEAVYNDMDCVEDFFESLNHEILLINTAKKKSILFRVGSTHNWLVTTGQGVSSMDSSMADSLKPHCTLTTDFSSMAQVGH